MRRLIACGALFALSACPSEESAGAGTETDGAQTSSTGSSGDPATTGSGTSTTAAESSSSTGEPPTGPGSETTTDADTDDESSSSTSSDESCVSDAAVLAGRAWHDADASDRSIYIASFDDPVDAPEPDLDVIVYGADAAVAATTSTCADGSYGVDDLAAGAYIVATPDIPEGGCAQKACPRHLWDVLAEGGDLKILTVGDSLPVEGAQPTFPARLADRLAPIVTVDNVNVAVGGSTSPDWIPGGAYYNSRVAPEIADADVVVISIGGNDFLNLASSADISNIAQVLADADALLVEVVTNVRTLSGAIREVNPDVDIVFTLYVEYSQSSISPWDLVGLLPPNTIYDLLAQVRDMIEPADEIVVVDVLEASRMLDGPLDDLLVDPLHFSDAGHDFYADEIFKTLGGVQVGGDEVAERNVSRL